LATPQSLDPISRPPDAPTPDWDLHRCDASYSLDREFPATTLDFPHSTLRSALVFYPRESRDSPILNAFWRVAPSVRFIVRAIFAADILFLASDFSSRTCADVQARLFDAFFTIKYLHV
jgi:hypothetical protein